MRTIKELLEVMVNNKQHFNSGLCGWCLRLRLYDIINGGEYNQLLSYIRKNRPFLTHLNLSAYYWKIGRLEPRIKWLKKHIKKNS